MTGPKKMPVTVERGSNYVRLRIGRRESRLISLYIEGEVFQQIYMFVETSLIVGREDSNKSKKKRQL